VNAGLFDMLHDAGHEDILAVARYAATRFGGLPVLLAGFSFGAFVQTRVAQTLSPEKMVLVGPAVNRFPAATVPAGVSTRLATTAGIGAGSWLSPR